jgi:hypothetical protein
MYVHASPLFQVFQTPLQIKVNKIDGLKGDASPMVICRY